MSVLHEITIDDPLVKEKLTFLADYFSYAATHRGYNDTIPIENHLSLVEKAVYQIENNPDHFHNYLSLYLDHPLLKENNRMIKDMDSFKAVVPFLQGYLTHADQKKWLQTHPEFLPALKNLASEINSKLFPSAVDSILHMIKCECSLETHKSDFIELVNCLVSEYAFRGISTKELDRLFTTLLNADSEQFPLPPDFTGDSVERKHFLETITTEDKIRGLSNLLSRPPKESYFLFKVSNCKTNDDFILEYDNVTFYNPKHPHLALIRKESEPHKLFFDDDVELLVAVHGKYQNVESQIQNSLSEARRAVQFINTWLNINCVINPYTYLMTEDFRSLNGFNSDWKSDGYDLHERDFEKLKDNPYEFLGECSEQSKGKLLFYERLFLEALSNRNPAIFWQYLEALIPLTSDRKKQIKTLVSNLLVLNAESYHHNRLRESIRNAFHPFHGNARILGIDSKRQLEIWKSQSFEAALKSEIKHPFLNHVLSEYQDTMTYESLISRKQYYYTVISDAYAQRNFAVHSGLAPIKTSIYLKETLTRLVTRLRWILFDGIKKYNGLPFDDIVTKLNQDADDLLSRVINDKRI